MEGIQSGLAVSRNILTIAPYDGCCVGNVSKVMLYIHDRENNEWGILGGIESNRVYRSIA